MARGVWPVVKVATSALQACVSTSLLNYLVFQQLGANFH